MRRLGLPGNVCCAVHRLGPGLDVELLRQRIAASPLLNWLARVRIVRPLPLLPPLWRTDLQPLPILHEHQDANGSDVPPWPFPPVVASRELHSARGPALTFDLVRHADGTHRLFLSWNHTLLDARGVDLLLKHLNSASTAKGAPTVEHFISPKQLVSGLAGWWPNVKTAQGSVKWLHESGKDPIFTLVPEGPAARSPRNLYRVVSFSSEETLRIGQRCQLVSGGFRRSHFYLAATLRGFHAVAVGRGNQAGAYLIPAPHDTRRRGANGPIFSNHLSILFYRIEPQHCGQLSHILEQLGGQMSNQIRDRFPDSCMAALDMFKPLPLGLYVRHLGRPTRGKFATFSFSDSGDTCAGTTNLFGAPILDITHLVPTWRPPGLTVVFLNFSGRLSALLSWVDDCLSPAEVDVLERGIRAALLEETVP